MNKLERLQAKIEKRFPKVWTRIEDGYLVSGEDAHVDVIDGDESFEMDVFDYYIEDYNEKLYVIGVWKEFRDFLESLGYYAEWKDCGTVGIYEI